MRFVDPGVFVRPGTSIVSIVNRSTVRVCAEVPEDDFDYVAPGTPVKLLLLATGVETSGTIARRSPDASRSTRTVHFEVNLSDPQRRIPIGTTAEMTIKIGTPEAASIIPVQAASVHEKSATIFVVDGTRAKKTVVPIKGELLGELYVDTALKPGTRVVTEGRLSLTDGAAISTTPDSTANEGRPTQAGAKP